MSIPINDNFNVNAPKNIDDRYSVGGVTPYVSVAAANAAIPISRRAIGLTVLIGGTEYWYQLGITDLDLVIKSGGGLSNPICDIQMVKTPNTLGTPVNFVHTNNGPEVDVITAGVTEFFRDAAQGIYNIAVEGVYNFPTSPLNTQWNSVYTDPINNGHANIQNVESRVHQDFVFALNGSIGNFILSTPLVMHDLGTDKYYLFTFTQWTQAAGGGGFAYTRTEVIISPCKGRITFDDNTWLDTAPTGTISGTPYRVAMFDTAGTGLTESLIECSPFPSVGGNNLTGSTDCLIIGNNISAVNANTSFAYGSNLDLQNANECFVVAHNNTTFDANGAFSCIILGNLCTFTNGAAGVYILGDTNSVNNTDYSAILGQNNNYINSSFCAISGAANTLNGCTNTVVVGRSNVISNGNNTAVIGINNNQTIVNNYVLIGRNNSSAVVAGTVNVLNTGFGLKLATTAAGIGGIGFNPTARFHIRGLGTTTNITLRAENSSGGALLTVRDDGRVNAPALPTTTLGLVAGDFWNNGGVVNIV